MLRREKIDFQKAGGLTDVHCHLLPGVDNGAKDMKEAASMLFQEIAQGVTTVCLTPHFQKGWYEAPQEKIDEQFAFLQKVAQRIPGAPRLLMGREYCCDRRFFEMLLNEKVVTLGNSMCLLLRFSLHCRPKEMGRYVEAAASGGYVPVITHIERYPCMQRDPSVADELIEGGAWLQVNTDAILGNRGGTQKRLCMKLLKRDKIQLVASDAHHSTVRAPNLGACAAYLEKKLSREQLERLLFTNPKQITEDGSKQKTEDGASV